MDNRTIKIDELEVDIKTIQVVHSPRCYRRIEYEVKAGRRLHPADFTNLRRNGAFMGGQECGTVMGEWEKDGQFYYICTSICDSGD